tara:strand:- start:9 stop:809 length:801 start_codon:yes stop_codon:yes gene_type:complete
MAKAGGLKGLVGGIGSFAAANPMLTQAGLGLLAGDKPINVARNVAYGSIGQGIDALGKGNTFMSGVQRGFGMTPAGATDPIIKGVGGDFASAIQNEIDTGTLTTNTILENAKKPGFLERFGLIKSGDDLGFFEKYSPLLKLGAVGATIASAAMSDKERQLFYDPTKNPYLKSGSADKDFFENINPYYSMNKGGGVMDFPEKDGMINGPGDGQSDDIPAMLSDGEFVMTKQAVMAAGNGNRNEGTKKMYDMMYSLEDKARNMGIGRV